MREFADATRMFRAALTDCLRDGQIVDSRDGKCKEVIGWSARLVDVTYNLPVDEIRKVSPVYAVAELLWYLSMSKNGDMIKAYAPQYERFLDENGCTTGAYGYRWMMNPGLYSSTANQLKIVVSVLKRPESDGGRRVTMTMYDAGDLTRYYDRVPDKDVPCTISLSFYRRGIDLHCVCHMRSNDAWLGLPYDVFCFTSIQRLVAQAAGLREATYTHTVGSMHIYDRNQDKARAIVERSAPEHRTWRGYDRDRCVEFPLKEEWNTEILRILQYEAAIRNAVSDRERMDVARWARRPSRGLLRDALGLIAAHWCPSSRHVLLPQVDSVMLRDAARVKWGDV